MISSRIPPALGCPGPFPGPHRRQCARLALNQCRRNLELAPHSRQGPMPGSPTTAVCAGATSAACANTPARAPAPVTTVASLSVLFIRSSLPWSVPSSNAFGGAGPAENVDGGDVIVPGHLGPMGDRVPSLTMTEIKWIGGAVHGAVVVAWAE